MRVYRCPDVINSWEKCMQRDQELLRKILMEIENKYNPGSGVLYKLEIIGYEFSTIAEHCKLLYQQGLISDYNENYANDGLIFFSVGNLTYSGYDYLELIRNEERWIQTKKEVNDKKLPETFEVIAKVAGAFIGQVINQTKPF